MNSLNNWLNKRSSRKILICIVLVLLLVGFLDATYLTVNHFTGASNRCILSKGCDVVTTSKYAAFGPVPIALIGAVYYATALMLTALFASLSDTRFLKLALLLVSVAVAVSAYLVFLQLFVIHALCIYCVTSAGTTTVSLIALLMLNKINQITNPQI